MIKSVIKLEINNLLTEEELEEFDGGVKMNKNTEDIIRQAVDEVGRKYEQEALDEAEIRGRNNVKIDVAKKLKGKFSNEEISEITGLSLNTVRSL